MTMKKLFVQFTLCCTFFSTLQAQQVVPFKTVKSFYIYGDAVAIGNNSLSKHATKPYNNFTLTNDDIEMVFVDIDKDKSTFSSSLATLQLPKNHSKIAYAALYWTGTYSYEKGGRREENGQFYFSGTRQLNRSVISKVKLKLPESDYQYVIGDVIFDGAKNTSFALSSPYVCYADVTNVLKGAKTLNGDYVVANIFATEGFVSGGSAAGWMLYIVYEAPTKIPKYITTFNGFAQVATKPVIITLDNFETPKKGKISTNMTIAALEGDSALTEDEFVIANPKLKRATKLSNKDRTENNFFRSYIDKNEKFKSRYPSSDNTLGFDIVSLNLDNQNDLIITNNTDKIELLFNTKKDLFYLFFTAFQTEISKDFLEEISINLPENAIVLASKKPKGEKVIIKEEIPIKKEPVSSVSKIKKSTIKTNPIPKIKPKEISLKQPEEEIKKELVSPISTEIATMSQAQKESINSSDVYIGSKTYVKSLKLDAQPLETQRFKLILEKNAAKVKGVDKGYYVINKFFSNPLNAVAWNKSLQDKGYSSKILVDEDKKLYYVYVFHTTNFYDAFMHHKTLVTKTLFKENWVFKINMDGF